MKGIINSLSLLLAVSVIVPIVGFVPTTSTSLARTTTRLFSSKEKTIPVHLLAGFLGSGKTTTLKHLLETVDASENDYKKFGIIVNDVASVNIDAKLVKNDNSESISGIIEMQNGCACCSLSDELFTSIESLITNKPDLDAVLIELSGVADPVAIQNNWKQAKNLGMEITNKVNLQNVITVVDSCTFGTDYMAWDVAGDRENWVPGEDCIATRKVVELLAEQVEAANLIVINKEDLATDEQVQVTESMARSLNEKAELITTSYGKVSVQQILKDYITEKQQQSEKQEEEAHSHSHDHNCEDPECTDSSHSHSHDHAASNCDDPDCTDTSHSHSHDHAAATAACTDPDCTDSSHSHSHDHAASACDDPDCTDTSHSHSHDHASSSSKTSTDNLGIVNFVYKSERPFNAGRLMELLYKWPVPIKDELDLSLLKDASKEGYQIAGKKETEPSPFTGVLRSKGFCWFAPTVWDGLLEDTWRNNIAMYWSHAGKHLGVQEAGRWWASVPSETMKEFFIDNPNEMERILREDFVSDEFGDRRQELVFIGVDLDQDAITNALNDCLLTDDEMDMYREKIAQLLEATAIDVQ